MTSQIHTQNQHTKKETQDLSNTPVEGMFKARPFVVQAQKANQVQQPDLKTSLIQAKRYGHHLNQIDSASASNPEALQPKMEIGKPVQLGPKRKSTPAAHTTPASTSTPAHTTTASTRPPAHTTTASTSTSAHTTTASTSTSAHTTPASTSTPAHTTPASTSTPAHTTPAVTLAQAQVLSAGGFVGKKGSALKSGERAGGFEFQNKQGKLPKKDSAGKAITYTEYDVNIKIGNSSRDDKRIVVGSDGTHWYTGDHYISFKRL